MNELQEKLNAIKLDKDTNLLPENLKAGVTCLGIEGTFEGGSGGAKIFESVEAMNASENNELGDLAVVYADSKKNATADSRFSKAVFPETVVLPTAMTDYADIMYRAVDDSVMFECWGQLDSSYFMMDCYTDTGNVRIQYESSDGITYNRTRLEGDGVDGDSVDFGVEIYYARSEMWNDAIGCFIQLGSSSFEGLYRYVESPAPDIILLNGQYYRIPYEIATTKLEFVGAELPYILTTEDVNQYLDGSIIHIVSTVPDEVYNDVLKITEMNLYYGTTVYGWTVITSDTGKMYACMRTVDNTSTLIRRLTSVNYKEGVGITRIDLEGVDSITSAYTDYVATEDSGATKYINFGVLNENVYIQNVGEATTNIYSTPTYGAEIDVETGLGSTELVRSAYDYPITYWQIAPTQFTISSNSVFPGEIGYGSTGIVTGDGNIWNRIPEEDFLRVYLGVTDPAMEMIPLTSLTFHPELTNPALYGLDAELSETENILSNGALDLHKRFDNSNASTGTMDYRVIQVDDVVYYLAFSGTNLIVQRGTVTSDEITWMPQTTLSLGVQLNSLNCTPIRHKDGNIYISGYSVDGNYTYSAYMVIYNVANNSVNVKRGPAGSSFPLSFDYDVDLGKLYYHRSPNTIYSWDITTTDEVMLTTVNSNLSNYGMYCDGTDVYTADIDVNTVYLINKLTAEVTPITLPANLDTNTCGRMCFIEGNYMYVVGNMAMYKIDLSTKTVVLQKTAGLRNGSGGWGPYCHFKLEADSEHLYFIRHTAYGTFTSSNRYITLYRMDKDTLETNEVYCPDLRTGCVFSGTINNTNVFAGNKFNIISDEYRNAQGFHYHRMIWVNIVPAKNALLHGSLYNGNLCVTGMTAEKLYE